MGLKISGQRLLSHLGNIASRFPEGEVEHIDNVYCMGDVISSNVFLDTHSRYDARYPNRPYLHILGRCQSIKGALPFGVSELTFPDGEGLEVDYFYEFSNEELADMANKGLFDAGFEVPDIFFGNTFEMPVLCDVLALAPDEVTNVPLVFVDIKDPANLTVTTETCGYTFGDYFEAPAQDFMLEDEIETVHAIDNDLVAEVEEVVEQTVEPTPLTPEQIALAEQYERIHRRTLEDHELRGRNFDEIYASSLSHEDAEALIAEMTAKKVLEPLPRHVEDASAKFEAVPVPLIEVEEPESEDVIVEETSEVVELEDVDDDVVVIENPIEEIEDVVERKSMPTSFADIEQAAAEAEVDEDVVEVSDAI